MLPTLNSQHIHNARRGKFIQIWVVTCSTDFFSAPRGSAKNDLSSCQHSLAASDCGIHFLTHSSHFFTYPISILKGSANFMITIPWLYSSLRCTDLLDGRQLSPFIPIANRPRFGCICIFTHSF